MRLQDVAAFGAFIYVALVLVLMAGHFGVPAAKAIAGSPVVSLLILGIAVVMFLATKQPNTDSTKEQEP